MTDTRPPDENPRQAGGIGASGTAYIADEVVGSVEVLKDLGYRIVKLEPKVDRFHYRKGEFDVVDEL